MESPGTRGEQGPESEILIFPCSLAPGGLFSRLCSSRADLMKTLLIPVKAPTGSKTRLSDLLSAGERKQLAWVMFEDVVRAVTHTREPDLIVLVSSFSQAVDRARTLGWDVIFEHSQVSESASIDWASQILRERGFDTVMRLPADLPLVRSEDIDDILSMKIDTPGALLVPSRDGTGTNAIVRTPPALFASRFGPNSLSLHKQEAARAGASCVVVNNERIALDIDEPADVEVLLERGRGTETYSTLVELDIFDRLSHVSGKARKDSQRTQSL